MADRLLRADKPDGQAAYACISPGFQGESSIADIRFAAFLRPFPDEDAARAALQSAGATNIQEAKR